MDFRFDSSPVHCAEVLGINQHVHVFAGSQFNMGSYERLAAILLCTALLGIAGVLAFSAPKSENQERNRSERSVSDEELQAEEINELLSSQNGTSSNSDLQYSFLLTMVNYGNEVVKVSQSTYLPDGVEIKSHTIEMSPANENRKKRRAGKEELKQWAGGVINIEPGFQDTSNLIYVNHPAEIFTPNSKTFHRLAAVIAILDDGLIGGEISTPNHPGDYPNGADITWMIKYPPGNIVRLEMLTYSLEECCDHLIVYDGLNKSSAVLGSFDGEGGSEVTISTTPAIFLRFTSDCLVTSTGFRAHFINQKIVPDTTTTTTETPEATATATINNTEIYYNPGRCGATTYLYGYTSILSPGYYSPGYYPNGENCTWIVQAYSGQVVRFEVHYFSLEYGFDNVRIYDGYGVYQPNLIAELTGYISHITVAISHSRYATLTFSSDSSVTDAGFYFHVYSQNPSYEVSTLPPSLATTGEPSICEDDYYYGYSGYFTSPNYPSYYSNNLNCTFWVNTPYGYDVRLTFQSFSLSYGDYLTVYDGYNGNYLRSFSGYHSYGYYYQAYGTNYIKLVFSTDESNTASGFNIRYQSVYGYYDTYTTVATSAECGEELYSDSGVITSPGFPYYEYSDNSDCTWTVHVSSNRYVLFTVNYFNTESGYDYVSICRGTPSYSYGCPYYESGRESSGTEILIQDNDAYLTFHSDSSVTEPGFNITYSEVPTYYVVSSTPDNNWYTTTWPYRAQPDMGRNLIKESADGKYKIIGVDLWDGAKVKPSREERESRKRKHRNGQDL